MSQRPASARPPRVQQPRGRGQRILFVDDEPTLVQLAKALLTALGYQPVAFADAHEALLAFRRDPAAFGAVVTDLSMPSMSGFELSRALLALRSDVPVLLMSGYVGPDERALAMQIGVRELALKPVTMDQLAELLARFC
jgi:DNA-binding NtrC family response regulator